MTAPDDFDPFDDADDPQSIGIALLILVGMVLGFAVLILT